MEKNNKIPILIKSYMKQESIEMFLKCCVTTTITDVNWQ